MWTGSNRRRRASVDGDSRVRPFTIAAWRGLQTSRERVANPLQHVPSMKPLVVLAALSSVAHAGTASVTGLDRNHLAAEGAPATFVGHLTAAAGEGATFTFRSSSGFVSATAVQPGLCTHTANGLVCAAAFALDDASVRFAVLGADPGPLTVTATTSSELGTVTASADERVVPAAAARIETTVDRDHVTLGEPVLVTTTVTNDGPAIADTLGTETLAVAFDHPGAVFGNVELVSANGWHCDPQIAAHVPRCVLDVLPVGQSATLAWRVVPQASLSLYTALHTDSTVTQNPDASPLAIARITVDVPADPAQPGGEDPVDPPANPDPTAPDPEEPAIDEAPEVGGCNTSTGGVSSLLVLVALLTLRRRRH